MADDVDLEAEQVVGEEEEAPPKKRALKVNKGMLIFGGIIIAEAVLLFFVFNMISGGNDVASADSGGENDKPAMSIEQLLKDARQIDLGSISIYDETDPQRGSPRRYMWQVKVYVKKESFNEIMMLVEGDNPDAMEFVKDELRRVVHEWMLRNGGEGLRSLEMQKEAPQRLKDHIQQEIPPLKDRVLRVTVEDFRPQKW